ncbi:polyadenylate-binding protein 2-like [Lactuca sativa]|uniref:polyadenylate-binding protein 2-like n=1 Tax=Lactuca sativa TaxID=4236 RepID=UPI000CD86AB4|nr:polyadenylate-binding protein 2-like [Lactuca sativa]
MVELLATILSYSTPRRGGQALVRAEIRSRDLITYCSNSKLDIAIPYDVNTIESISSYSSCYVDDSCKGNRGTELHTFEWEGDQNNSSLPTDLYEQSKQKQILDKAIDQKALYSTFSTFGNILSCRIATDSSGQSKGYGFVQYDAEESAQKAIEKLKDMLLNDRQVYVGPFLHKQERDLVVDKTKLTNVYVKNLSESTTYDDLNKTFSEFGTVTSAVVTRDAEGNSKCFGFLNFENAEDAGKAVEGLNGQKFDNKEWYVGKAQNKYEREQELKQRFEQSMKEAVDKSQSIQL